jgi:hypothetical protein
VVGSPFVVFELVTLEVTAADAAVDAFPLDAPPLPLAWISAGSPLLPELHAPRSKRGTNAERIFNIT